MIVRSADAPSMLQRRIAFLQTIRLVVHANNRRTRGIQPTLLKNRERGRTLSLEDERISVRGWRQR